MGNEEVDALKPSKHIAMGKSFGGSGGIRAEIRSADLQSRHVGRVPDGRGYEAKERAAKNILVAHPARAPQRLRLPTALMATAATMIRPVVRSLKNGLTLRMLKAFPISDNRSTPAIERHTAP